MNNWLNSDLDDAIDSTPSTVDSKNKELKQLKAEKDRLNIQLSNDNKRIAELEAALERRNKW